jgi:hypothetical protein
MHWLILIALGVTLGAPALAQDSATPDISGTWTLKLAKSKLKQVPPWPPKTIVITCSGFTVEMRSKSASGVESTWKYVADWVKHPVSGGWQETAQMTTRTSWVYSALVTESTFTNLAIPALNLPVTERWTPSSDGRMLTHEWDGTKPVLVYDREAAGQSQCRPFQTPVERIF